MKVLLERKGIWHLYRFDYKYNSLPYYCYVEFRDRPANSSLYYLKRKFCAYNIERCSVSEKSSVYRHDIPVFTFSQLKKEFRRLKAIKLPLLNFNKPDNVDNSCPY